MMCYLLMPDVGDGVPVLRGIHLTSSRQKLVHVTFGPCYLQREHRYCFTIYTFVVFMYFCLDVKRGRNRVFLFTMIFNVYVYMWELFLYTPLLSFKLQVKLCLSPFTCFQTKARVESSGSGLGKVS